MTITMEFKMDAAALKKLESIPALLHYEVIDKAIPAMVKPIIAKAKQIAPRSNQTGTRLKWGNKKTDNFNPATWKKDESADHIGYRINKRSAYGALVKVGARSPRGNKQRFNQTKYVDRRVFYWGHDAGKTWRNPDRRFMDRAYDETLSQQVSAFTQAIQKWKLP